MTEILAVLILVPYGTLILAAIVITYFSYGSLRFHPVVTLMASGVIAPTMTLCVLRLGGLFGYNTSRNDIPTQIALLIGFTYAGWSWIKALRLVYEDRQSTRRGRSKARRGVLDALRD